MPTWFFIALSAPFLWALVNIADSFLVAKFSDKEKEHSSGALALFASLIAFLVAIGIWIFTQNISNIPVVDKILLLTSGVLTIVWVILYLFALEMEETSKVTPWFLVIPVFGYILGYFFLGETLSLHQILGSLITFLGLIVISIDFSGENRKIKHKPVFYMLCVALCVSISGVLFKYVTIENNFWVSSFWEYLGVGFSGLFIYLFIPHYRNMFRDMNKKGGYKIFLVNVVTEFMTISGNLLTNYALLLAPVALVYMVGSFQPAIVLLLTLVFTKFWPSVASEDFSKRIIIPKVIAILIMLFGSFVMFF